MANKASFKIENDVLTVSIPLCAPFKSATGKVAHIVEPGIRPANVTGLKYKGHEVAVNIMATFSLKEPVKADKTKERELVKV